MLGRKGFAPDASLCYDVSPCYFTNVDRDLNVFCICYSLIFLQEWVYFISPQPKTQPGGPGDHNLSGPYLSTYERCKTPADIAHRVLQNPWGGGIVKNIFGVRVCKGMDFNWNTIEQNSKILLRCRLLNLPLKSI